MWLWKRLNVVGPVVWELVTLHQTEAEALQLLDGLYTLNTCQAEFKHRYPKVKLLWEAH